MTTSLLGVQFIEEKGDINIAIISSNWLTPKKKHGFWPPYKKQYQYEQSLKKGEIPTDEWIFYDIQKILFTEKDNDYHKAKKQLQYCEENSDIPSDFDTVLKRFNTVSTSRSRKRPNRYCEQSDNISSEQSNSEDEESVNGQLRVKKKCNSNRLPRPPAITTCQTFKQ
ncbi:PREDICTED: uncharacterized protein LOC105448755 [Wasmannia auropunctata]|uniref:uncharacterized protein LOC105448755 n=1 Tax=Wasmannia auropunctata TaxID=64793 RepID=UPI0005EF9B66|nr:PREDICTED: uncharacterized protein LOC105448755 [Wasmannia auropunctata]